MFARKLYEADLKVKTYLLTAKTQRRKNSALIFRVLASER